MKRAGLLLLITAGMLVLAQADEASPGLVSRGTKDRILESLPVYQPPPTDSDGATTQPTPPVDRDLLILPKLTVIEKRLPRDAADHLMSKADFNRKMEKLYLDTLAEDGQLNVFLNSIAIPILNQVSIPIPPRRDKNVSGRAIYRSVEIARGRAIYRAKEINRLEHVVDVSKDLDPGAAKKFKQEMDNTHTTRPAGMK